MPCVKKQLIVPKCFCFLDGCCKLFYVWMLVYFRAVCLVLGIVPFVNIFFENVAFSPSICQVHYAWQTYTHAYVLLTIFQMNMG